MNQLVINLIRNAFKSVKMPNENTLTVSRGDEQLEDTEPFRNQVWSDVSLEAISLHYYALFWFTDEAFHYYLPAFLLTALDFPQETVSITLILQLKPNKDREKETFRRARWMKLDSIQVDALEAWAARICELNPSDGGSEFDDALRVIQSRYWWK